MDLKEAFKVAMQGEIEGRELYAAAAEKVSDAKAKEVFSNLSKEENLHFEHLQKLAQSHFEGKPVLIPQLAKIETFADAQSPIFTREFKDFINGRHFEMATLSIGMKLELESSKFYSEMAESTKDKPLKDFFRYLADWEEGHYQALKQQIGFLKEHYELQNSLFRF